MPDANSGRFDRLAQALGAYLRCAPARGEEGGEAFLAQHADLREFLEPMLAADRGPEPRPEGEARVLGDFRIVREVGRGGMGVVYEAVQLSLDRTVALKVLPAHLTLQASAIARFKREALTAARLEHPGIVKVLAVGSEEDTHFFAMEFVDGLPLDRALAAETSSSVMTKQRIETIVNLVLQVADALQHAHDAGVIHRDVKPPNILVRGNGTAVLSDFGLAREDGLPSLTLTGAFAGTPHYVSPEQAAARPGKVDHRSDVFSLGATLYELLTRRRPFEGKSARDVLERIQNAEPADPHRLQPLLAPDLVAIVLKALEKDPGRRYQSAAAFATDLRSFLAYRPVAAKRASSGARLWRWVRREPARAALAVGVALAGASVAGLGGYLLAHRNTLHVGIEKQRHDELEQRIADGFQLLALDEPARARVEFERALSLESEHPEAVAGIAISFKWKSRPEAGLAFLERHETLVGETRGLLRLRAGMLKRAGRVAEAEQITRELGPPRDALDHFVLGSQELGDSIPGDARSQRALRHLSLAARLTPTPRLFLHAEWAKAAAKVESADAERECAAAIEHFWPDNPTAWTVVALALQDLDPAGALARVQRAIAREPDNAFHYSTLGLVQSRRKDFPAAAAALRRALEIEPQSAILWFNLGGVLDNAKDLDGAVIAYRTAVSVSPGHAPSHYNLGCLLSGLGDARAAAREFRAAIEADPQLAQAYVNLVDALGKSGEDEHALELFRKAAAASPRLPQAHRGLCGQLETRQDFAALRQEHERWANLHAEDADTQAELAEFLVRQDLPSELRDPARALELAWRAVALTKGEQWWSLSVLSRAQLATGDPAGALWSLERARRSVPGLDANRVQVLAALEQDLQRLRKALRASR